MKFEGKKPILKMMPNKISSYLNNNDQIKKIKKNIIGGEIEKYL